MRSFLCRAPYRHAALLARPRSAGSFSVGDGRGIGRSFHSRTAGAGRAGRFDPRRIGPRKKPDQNRVGMEPGLDPAENGFARGTRGRGRRAFDAERKERNLNESKPKRIRSERGLSLGDRPAFDLRSVLLCILPKVPLPRSGGTNPKRRIPASRRPASHRPTCLGAFPFRGLAAVAPPSHSEVIVDHSKGISVRRICRLRRFDSRDTRRVRRSLLAT